MTDTSTDYGLCAELDDLLRRFEQTPGYSTDERATFRLHLRELQRLLKREAVFDMLPNPYAYDYQ